jgi:hypothetical protein
MHRCSNPDTQVFRWCLAHVTYVAPASATHITTSDPPLTVSPHRRRPPPSPPIISSHPRRHVSCKLSADARRNAAPACVRLRDTCSPALSLPGATPAPPAERSTRAVDADARPRSPLARRARLVRRRARDNGERLSGAQGAGGAGC